MFTLSTAAVKMATPITPVKNPKCFYCFSRGPWRLYDIDGRKWIKDEIGNKLTVLLGVDTTGKLEKYGKEGGMGLCASCVKSVADAYNLVQKLKSNVDRLPQTKRDEGKRW